MQADAGLLNHVQAGPPLAGFQNGGRAGPLRNTGQNRIVRMGRFSRRKRSLGMKRKMKRAMRSREMRKMRLFQTMTWSTV